MKSFLKRSYLIIFSWFFIASCNTEFTKDNNGMFGILNMQLEDDNMYLLDDVDNKISITIPKKLSFDKTVEVQISIFDSITTLKLKKYHSLTEDYYNFLSTIENEFANNNNPFFHNETITNKGNEYLAKSKFYKEEILKFTTNDMTRNRIHSKVSVSDMFSINDIKISHLNYYFDDLPTKGIVVYLKSKKRNILELEKDFLNELIIENLIRKLTVED